MSPFWQLNARAAECALICQDGATVGYRELACLADEMAHRLPRAEHKQLGFILFTPTPSLIALYLGTLRSGRHVPLLLHPGIHPSLLSQLANHYNPSWTALPPDYPSISGYEQTFGASEINLAARDPTVASAAPLHPELGLLLPTSGTTGSQKLVRLSYEAIADNASAIARYLALSDTDRAITTLPLSYSFGLSILNSHLAAHGSIILTADSVISRSFWETAAAYQPTSISGVPSTFEMLRRAKLEGRGLLNLRMLTQAGGSLRDELIVEFNQLCLKHDWEFFVMYGQTEAAPRISFVPPRRLADKVGSIGMALPGGKLELSPQSGELIYRGRNVMLGYAECRSDLERGDELCGVLHTGDTARQDSEGYFFLTGRLGRFIKLSGTRINLDDIEAALSRQFSCQFACTGDDNRMTIALELADQNLSSAHIIEHLRTTFGIFPGQVDVRYLDKLPLMTNGKIDYAAIQMSPPASSSQQKQ